MKDMLFPPFSKYFMYPVIWGKIIHNSLIISLSEFDGHIIIRFLDVAWDDDISTVKECLDEGVLVDSVTQIGHTALKHL